MYRYAVILIKKMRWPRGLGFLFNFAALESGSLVLHHSLNLSPLMGFFSAYLGLFLAAGVDEKVLSPIFQKYAVEADKGSKILRATQAVVAVTPIVLSLSLSPPAKQEPFVQSNMDTSYTLGLQ